MDSNGWGSKRINMYSNNVASRVSRLGTAALFALSFISSSVFIALAPAPVSAEVPALPAPTAPSDTCEWMGEMHWLDSYSWTSTTSTATTTSQGNNRVDAVSAPVEGEECGMLWSQSKDSMFQTTLQQYCEGTTKLNTRTDITTMEGSGTGRYTAALKAHNGDPLQAYLDYEARGTAGDSLVKRSSTNTACTSHDYYMEYSSYPVTVSAWCLGQLVNKDKLFVDPNAQSAVGKCTYNNTHTSDTGSSNTSVELSWRMRKVSCDASVDTDGGGASDCKEYEDATDPMDASDDVVNTVSPEVQTITNVAAATEQECFGQVAKLGAKDAAAGKGIKNTFEYWNLVGVPGITESSTFQQKMDAVRDYCKAN